MLTPLRNGACRNPLSAFVAAPHLATETPVTAPAGSVLFAHYLLAHNIGGHDGEAADERRETVYYRLHASGHRERWREAVTNPLAEFRQ